MSVRFFLDSSLELNHTQKFRLKRSDGQTSGFLVLELLSLCVIHCFDETTFQYQPAVAAPTKKSNQIFPRRNKLSVQFNGIPMPNFNTKTMKTLFKTLLTCGLLASGVFYFAG